MIFQKKIFIFFPFFIFLVLGCGGTNPTPKSLTSDTTPFDPSNGGISGIIVSSSSATIDGAYVETTGRQTVSASGGGYLLYPLTAGEYQVIARYSGFSPGYKNQVQVYSGKITEDANISLYEPSGSATSDLQVLLINPFYGTDGDEISVIGRAFGQVPGKVTVNGKEAFILDWNSRNDGLIRIRLPNEVESGPVKVTLKGQTSYENPPVTFVAKPVAIEAKPKSAKAGEKVAIIGRNFYPIVSFNKVFLNGKSCDIQPDSTTTQLNILMPQGAESGTFQIRIETETFQLDGISTAKIVIPAELVFLSPQRSLPGTILTLTGKNLGTDPTVVQVYLGDKRVIGNNEFLKFGDDRIEIRAPDNVTVLPGESISISLSVDSAQTASWTWTSFDPNTATLQNYGIFDFSTVSTGNTLRLAQLSPRDRLAFVSTLSSDGSNPLSTVVYGYSVTSLLGNNRSQVPSKTSVRALNNQFNTQNPSTDYGPMLRQLAATITSEKIPPKILRMEANAPASATFWLANLSATEPGTPGNDYLINATLKATGTFSLIYTDDSSTANILASEASDIAYLFDQVYRKLSDASTFGVKTPPEGNVDNQTRIVYLLTPQLNNGLSGSKRTLGYFNPRDKVATATHTAGTEIIYLYDQEFRDNKENFCGAMAHELQHMIYYNQKGNEGAVWIDEGLSVLAQDIAGYGYKQGVKYPVDFVGTYLGQPNRVSLNNWPEPSKVGLENYGLSYIFMEYAFEQCQNYQTVKALHTYRYRLASGLKDITDYVLPLWNGPIPGNEARLIEFFHQFGAAMYCDDIGTTTIPIQYSFQNISLRGAFPGVSSLRRTTLDENPITGKPFEMKGFSCDVIEYVGGNYGDVEFTLHDTPADGRFKMWVIYLPMQ